MKRKFYCKCGRCFDYQWHINEHIGICNPHWPRTSDEDEHIQVTSDEWHALPRAIRDWKGVS